MGRKTENKTGNNNEKAQTLSYHKHLLMLRTYEKWISADHVFYKRYF